MTKYSIIIPVYNSEKYLEECIESVLKQTYKEIEIIIVNDGSYDSSENIINRYAKNDNRIIYLKQKNAGVSAARNLGIKSATGKWITFVDSDDTVRESYIECVDKLILNIDMDMFMYGTDQTENICDIFKLTKSESAELCMDENKTAGYVWNKFFKRDIIFNNNIKFNTQISVCEDLLFCFNYIQYVDIAYYYNCKINRFYNYRVHLNSTIQNQNADKIKTSMEVYEQIKKCEFLSLKTKKKAAKLYNKVSLNCLLLEWQKICKIDKNIRKKYIVLIQENYKCLFFKDYVRFLMIYI
ncbi:MAG: glycosyltransferase, partial [Agathobacter sp.]|nr:glycosyltransferase [Agathobacter sp.]